MSEGMTKLVFSSMFDDTVDVGMRIVEDPAVLRKSASTVFDCDYKDMQPDNDHVGIHLVALGDFEHYGSNRNGDGFPKQACIDYHQTFVDHGHVYRHHRNKDPEKSLGKIVKSAYNEPMGRVELYIHVNKEKAEDELQKLASDGTIPYSMACRVPFDRCSVCNTLRKSAADDNQCEHVRDSLGKTMEDGRVVCTQNDTPTFFDISFVGRPADRIAWDLKVASARPLDSVKLAEAEAVYVPDSVAIISPDSQRKLGLLRKLAGYESLYVELQGRAPRTIQERHIHELQKLAADADNTAIDMARMCEPGEFFYEMAKRAAVLSPLSFFQYALKNAEADIQTQIPAAIQLIPGMFSRMQKSGTCQLVCNNHTFDVRNILYVTPEARAAAKEAAAASSLGGPDADERIIDATVSGITFTQALDKSAELKCNSNVAATALAETYMAYKLAAVDAITRLRKDLDTDALAAAAVAQNMTSKA